MSMKEQKDQKAQITHLQRRIIEIVDELRATQSELKGFKEAVARDIKRTIDLVKEKRQGE